MQERFVWLTCCSHKTGGCDGNYKSGVGCTKLMSKSKLIELDIHISLLTHMPCESGTEPRIDDLEVRMGCRFQGHKPSRYWVALAWWFFTASKSLTIALPKLAYPWHNQWTYHASIILDWNSTALHEGTCNVRCSVLHPNDTLYMSCKAESTNNSKASSENHPGESDHEMRKLCR